MFLMIDCIVGTTCWATRQDKTITRNGQQENHKTGWATRQDKTGRDLRRQDKTRQDKTRQDKTRQDKTRQGKARQGKARPALRANSNGVNSSIDERSNPIPELRSNPNPEAGERPPANDKRKTRQR